MTTRGARPPRWAEWMIRALLKPRDRETVTGDLLEEYREVILPARGCARALLWYLAQMLLLVDSAAFGVAIGAGVGVWILVDTALAPLAEDTPLVVGSMFAGLLVLFAVPGFTARRRGGRVCDSIQAGAIAGALAMVLFGLLGIVRVNVFLDVIRDRSDWEGLIAGFAGSGFQSLRTYANYIYLQNLMLLPMIGAAAGAVSGAIGGLFAAVERRPGPPHRIAAR
jgi:hypothetical protein